MKRYYFVLLILLLATACRTALRTEDQGIALSDDTVIVYGRSGGFAGLQQEWTIHADGRIDLPDGSQKQVEVAKVKDLFATIQTANFQTLNESYLPEDDCCDLFTYTVTVQTGAKAQTVSMMEGTTNVPGELTAVFQTIDQLIQTAK